VRHAICSPLLLPPAACGAAGARGAPRARACRASRHPAALRKRHAPVLSTAAHANTAPRTNFRVALTRAVCCAARAQQQAPALTPELLSLTAELASLGGGDARLGAPVACARVRPPRGSDNAAAPAAAAAGTYAPRGALPAVSVAADGVTVGACAPRRCAAAAPLHAHAHACTHTHWPCIRTRVPLL
jgi:hypothetical protein